MLHWVAAAGIQGSRLYKRDGMKAAVLHEKHQPLKAGEFTLEPPLREVLVKMAGGGVCRPGKGRYALASLPRSILASPRALLVASWSTANSSGARSSTTP